MEESDDNMEESDDIMVESNDHDYPNYVSEANMSEEDNSSRSEAEVGHSNVPEASMGGTNDDDSENEDRPERSEEKDLNISFVENPELRENLSDKKTIKEETDDTDADDQ
ncbi:hypothetical protein TWF730_006143 [Orbilia blumenaviensis]|uniref:DNA-binding protein PTAC3 n=1 Tax=Orbilia blumenaviensis TaxID=1796055 RepID=A0AAV9TVP6_9PEZI